MLVSGRARYTYSNKQPLGAASANRWERRPCSSIAISSPGSTSRTKAAPTMSRAAVSLATTQPRSKRPSVSGRMPCGSRAAYNVFSSMKTKEKAPRTSGNSCSAAVSSDTSGWVAKRPERTSVSVVACRPALRGNSPESSARALSRSRSSRVLVKFPLWPSARFPVAVERKVGCAFSHTLAPVVE